MVRSNHFFDEYPSILNYCLEVNQELKYALGNRIIAENNVNFDLILPFLFEDFELATAKLLSKELRLHREVVDRYNSKVADVEEFVKLIRVMESPEPVNFRQYQLINRHTRKLIGNDIVSSYITSTERVYYRFLILDKTELSASRKMAIIKKVRCFSAFLLFDDDVYDLDFDTKSGKKTILTEYLNTSNLKQAVSDMRQLLVKELNLFGHFVKQFEDIYKNV